MPQFRIKYLNLHKYKQRQSRSKNNYNLDPTLNVHVFGLYNLIEAEITLQNSVAFIMHRMGIFYCTDMQIFQGFGTFYSFLQCDVFRMKLHIGFLINGEKLDHLKFVDELVIIASNKEDIFAEYEKDGSQKKSIGNRQTLDNKYN